jgi:hypothetical protein
MEVTITTPGHHIIETIDGLPRKILSTEALSGQLSDIIQLIEFRFVQPLESSVVVNQDLTVNVCLNRNPTEQVFTTTFNGETKPSQAITDLRINGSGWEIKSLAKMIRFNPHLFEDPYQATVVFKALINHQSTKTKSVSNEQDQRGNQQASRASAVNTTIPEQLELVMPLLSGGEVQRMVILIELNPDDDLIYLIKTDLNKLLYEARMDEIREIVKYCNTNSIPVINK